MATRENIILGALELVEAVAAGETPATADSDLCVRQLDNLLAELSIDGAMWSRQKSLQRTLGAAEAYIPLDASVHIAGGLVITRPDENGKEVELVPYSHAEWARVQDKAATGTPLNYYLSPGNWLYVYPVTEEEIELTLYFEGSIPASQASAAPRLPPAWAGALEYGIAYRIAPRFGADPTPLQIEWLRLRSYLLERDIEGVTPNVEVDD